MKATRIFSSVWEFFDRINKKLMRWYFSEVLWEKQFPFDKGRFCSFVTVYMGGKCPSGNSYTYGINAEQKIWLPVILNFIWEGPPNPSKNSIHCRLSTLPRRQQTDAHFKGVGV